MSGTAFAVGRSIRIGSARGVAIQIHPSFVLVFLWVLYQWAIAADAGLTGVVFGTLVLTAVFGCVLLHELAHAATAMRYGLKVRDITLLPIGGVARIEHTMLSPRAETLIALAGPALNLAIAVVIFPIIVLIGVSRHADHPLAVLLYVNEISVPGFVLYLWIANLLLAVFNLLPAFPMDGGRVLRAVLTHFTNRLAATRIAVIVGQVMAATLAIFGLWIGDYLLLLVSLFVLAAAQLEAHHVQIESSLRALPVGQFALWETGGIRPDVSLALAIKGGPKDMVVTQEGQVVGMLWRRDLLRHLNGAHHELYVRDVMDRSVSTADVNDSVYDVHLWLSASNLTAVAVVEHAQYRGVFTHERLADVYQHLNRRALRRQRTLLRGLLVRLGRA